MDSLDNMLRSEQMARQMADQNVSRERLLNEVLGHC